MRIGAMPAQLSGSAVRRVCEGLDGILNAIATSPWTLPSHVAILRMPHGFLLYDELIKVPLIVKLSHQASAGNVVDAQVSSLDIVPTILDVLGIDHSGYPGRSLLPLIRGEDSEPCKAVSEYYRRPLSHHKDVNTNKLSIRLPDAKLIAHTQQEFLELYDLIADPRERRNLMESPSLEVYSRAADMLIALTSELKKSPPVSTSAEQPRVSPELEEQLRALGYVK
ncbi:MAG TPA: DUF4976 domain-containing protein [Proteobacteria bacterium]|nr:DUF4976 domain-containing protein [Pseudomonadota bacterium]